MGLESILLGTDKTFGIGLQVHPIVDLFDTDDVLSDDEGIILV